MNNRYYADGLDSIVVNNGVVNMIFVSRDVQMLQSDSISPDEKLVKHCVTIPAPSLFLMLQLVDRLRGETWVQEGMKSLERAQQAGDIPVNG